MLESTFGVQRVRQSDVDGVDARIVKKRPVVAVRAWDAVLPRVHISANRVAARDRDHLREFRLAGRGEDLGVDGCGESSPKRTGPRARRPAPAPRTWPGLDARAGDGRSSARNPCPVSCSTAGSRERIRCSGSLRPPSRGRLTSIDQRAASAGSHASPRPRTLRSCSAITIARNWRVAAGVRRSSGRLAPSEAAARARGGPARPDSCRARSRSQTRTLGTVKERPCPSTSFSTPRTTGSGTSSATDGWLGVHAEQHMRTVRGDIAARARHPVRGVLARGPSARGGPASAILTAFANHEMTKKDA